MKILAFFLGFLLLGLELQVLAAPAVQVPGCPLGYACVDASMTVPQLQAVINTGGTLKSPIYFLPGDYTVCSQMTITNNGTVLTSPGFAYGDNGSTGPPSPATARISCGSAGSFSNGQAFIQINAQYVTIQNLTFIGLQGIGGAPTVDCVQLLAGGNTITHNNFEDCYNGVHIIAVNTGCCSSFNQTSHVEFNMFQYNGFSGINCEATTGSGCTDNFFNFNHLDVLFLNADILCGIGCGNQQFIGNRVEDGGTGFYFNGPASPQDGFATINDNYFQDIAPILIHNTFGLLIEGNQFNCFPQASPGIEVTGAASSASFVSNGNEFSSCSANYQVDGAGEMTGPNMINDIYNSGPIYANTTTATQLEPWQISANFGPVIVPNVSNTFTPVLDGNARMFEIDLTANSTLADFTYHVSDPYTPITFKFKQDATGGRTVTYNAAYINTPTIGATASLCSYIQAHMTPAKVIFFGASVNNVSCT